MLGRKCFHGLGSILQPTSGAYEEVPQMWSVLPASKKGLDNPNVIPMAMGFPVGRDEEGWVAHEHGRETRLKGRL